MLTQAQLKSLLHYDPGTGEFTWVVQVGRGCGIKYPGEKAGFANGDGQIRIGISGRQHVAHRLAWLWMTGEWPINLIDHKDLNRENNKWDNLRPATNSQNAANARARATNKSGLKGVCWNVRDHKWQASITVKYHQRSLGYFDCPAAAHFAYAVAAHQAFGEFARAA